MNIQRNERERERDEGRERKRRGATGGREMQCNGKRKFLGVSDWFVEHNKF